MVQLFNDEEWASFASPVRAVTTQDDSRTLPMPLGVVWASSRTFLCLARRVSTGKDGSPARL